MRTEDKYWSILFFICVPAFISVGTSTFTWNSGTKAHKTLQIVSCSWEGWCSIGLRHSRGQYKKSTVVRNLPACSYGKTATLIVNVAFYVLTTAVKITFL